MPIYSHVSDWAINGRFWGYLSNEHQIRARGRNAMSRKLTKRRSYTDQDKRAAVMEYLIKGNQAVVSRALGIPEMTLSTWRTTDWWESLEVELRSEKKDQIEAELSTIIEKAHKETIDRLDNGDEVNTKDGLKRIKMRGRDTATVGAIAYDKLRLSQNLPTSIKSESSTVEALARQFAELSRTWEEKKINSIPGECEEIK